MAKTKTAIVVVKKPPGRPTKKTPEVITEIHERLSLGEPLAAICRSPGMPHHSTVWEWMQQDAEVSRTIAHAREVGEEALLAECLAIADTPCNGVTERYEPVEIENPDDPEGDPIKEFQLVERKIEDMLGHRKLQIETRLKLLAKWNPKKYGERLALDHDVVGSLAANLKAARERAGIR